jgi:hypothetical protein
MREAVLYSRPRRSKGLRDYPQDSFLHDLTDEAERDIRECLAADAACVQVGYSRLKAETEITACFTGR